MAVNANLSQPIEQLRPKTAVLAGLVSGGVALAAAAALVVFTLTTQKPDQPFPLWLIPVALGLAAVAICGLQLAKLTTWAQQGLLAFWLLGAVAALTTGMVLLLQGAPSAAALSADKGIGGFFWEMDPASKDVRLHLTHLLSLAGTLAVSLAAAGLLTVSSQPNSRLRYSTMVILSSGAAIAVLLVVNLIARDTFTRRDVQWYGQYGLSDRSKKILASVHERVQITSLYSTSDANPGSVEQANRVWDLLTEIHDLNPRIEIARANDDPDRDAIKARIAQQLHGRAPAYAALLKSFLDESPKLLEQFRSQEDQWKQLAGNSYLNLWGTAALVVDVLRTLEQGSEESQFSGLQQLDYRLRKDLSGLPDYPKLADEVKGFCTPAKEALSRATQRVETLAKIPAAVNANRAATGARLDAVVTSLKQANRALTASGATQTSQPSDPGDLLKAFTALVADTADKAADAAQSLDEVAGPENAAYVRASRAWLIGGDTGLPDENGLMSRYDLSTAFRDVSKGLQQQQLIAQSIARTMTKEYQAKVLSEMRTGMAQTVKDVSSLVVEAKKAIDRLATVDPATADILKQVADGKTLKGPIAVLTGLLDQAAKLPALPPSTLAKDATERNTVLIETADKTEAVPFSDVWPVRFKATPGEGPETSEPRFNGDSAICSKILTLTQKPCATVILAYIPVPQRMVQMGVEPPMPPQALEAMQGRLRQANFRVKTWDMSASDAPTMVDEPNEPALPKVLIVLPPLDVPPMMMGPEETGAFGPEYVMRLRKEIDSGDVAGAIFLAMFQPPARSPAAPPRHYGWNDYLKPDWGIEAKTTYLIVPAQRDDERSEGDKKFRLDDSRLEHLPLSTFSDHPIGKPLQGQRVYWSNPVPVEAVAAGLLPPGVKVEPLLTVPSYWTNTWATGDLRRIVEQFQETGSYISPDWAGGDMKPPFDVAMAARREGDPAKGVSPSRVVVLGMGGSFVDAYLERPVFRRENKGITSEDPPKGDLDVVVNSAYWVCARDEYIASGPVQVQPIRKIEETSYRVLWTLCVVGLPAVLLCLGGLVVVLRKR